MISQRCCSREIRRFFGADSGFAIGGASAFRL
jgi:hypothetical protein